MDIRITNYDEYVEACERKGRKPHTEAYIIENVTEAGRLLQDSKTGLKTGESVGRFLRNHDVDEYYRCRKKEENVCEIWFQTFME